jgi:arylsulfatase A-like enzyme
VASARPALSGLALALFLAVILAATKAAHWGVPDLAYVSLRDYVRDLAVSVHADLVFAAGFGLAGAALLRALRPHPRSRRAAGWTLLGLGVFSAAYAVVSIQVFDFLRSPLTYPLLYLAGDMKSMRSSIGSFASPVMVAAVIVAPVAYALLVPLASRRLALFGPRHRAGLGLAGLLLVAGIFAYGRHQAEGRWADRADHLIARNPHWTFLASLKSAVSEPAGPGAGEAYPRGFLADFEPSLGAGGGRVARPVSAGSPRPRNVVVVVLESTGAEYLGLYGSRYATTPRLEAEAAHAVVFDSFYCHVGLTANSLAALTLSLYPYMTWREYTVEYPDFPGETLAQILDRQGYRTSFLHSGFLDYVGQDRFLRNRGYDQVLDWDDLGRGPAMNSWGGTDAALVDSALDWIGKEPGQPFYAVLWTVQSHHPYDPVPGQPLVDFFAGSEPPPDDYDLGRYLNTVAEVDRQLGRLFDGLRARGLADDTLVVVTGDHGQAFGHPHPTWGHGFGVYEENVRVPLMVWNPRLFPKGRRADTVGGHVDVNATIADLLGVPSSPHWHGRSLFAPDRPPRAYFYAANGDYLLAVREGEWKYVRNATRGVDQLFHLTEDPDELRNVADRHPEKVRELRQRVAAWRDHAAGHLARARQQAPPSRASS